MRTNPCRHCQNPIGINVIARHELKCRNNPNMIRKHTKICPQCGREFYALRPERFHTKTCSHLCSNRYHTQSKRRQVLVSYRTICFRYHKKKCIICEETNIVTVHHFDENRKNNDPANLVPLCPTHHHYLHSNFKHLIEKQVKAYVKKFKNKVLKK